MLPSAKPESLQDVLRDLGGIAQTRTLGPGATLFRARETSRDFYAIQEGVLEVVDTAGPQPIVLRTFGKGEIVGEMSFLLDDEPRTAEIRARDQVVLLQFDKVATDRHLDRDGTLAVRFYRALAVELARRMRVSSRWLRTSTERRSSEDLAARTQLTKSLDHAIAQLSDLQVDAGRDAASVQHLTGVLERFGDELQSQLAALRPGEVEPAMREVRTRLKPLLGRARTFALCAHAERVATVDVVRHVLGGRPNGGPEGAQDGFGAAVDAWLLERPSLRGLRERDALAAQLLLEQLHGQPGPWTLGFVNPVSDALLGKASSAVGAAGGTVWCVTDRRDDVLARSSAVTVRTHGHGRVRERVAQDDLVLVAAGEVPFASMPPAHLVVTDGLFDYLPDRLAFGLVRAVRALVVPGGRVMFTWMGVAARDDVVLRHLLDWPVIRRERSDVARFLEDAGYVDVQVHACSPCGGVAIGAVPPAGGASARVRG